MINYLATFVTIIIGFFKVILLARIIMSWFPISPRQNSFTSFLDDIAGPILEWARKVIPPVGMLDISPIFLFIGIEILESMLLALLKSL